MLLFAKKVATRSSYSGEPFISIFAIIYYYFLFWVLYYNSFKLFFKRLIVEPRTNFITNTPFFHF